MDTGFFSTLRAFKITSRKHRIADDDFVDRLNHYHTAIVICVLSIIICAKQYIVGQPLQCWVPVEFTGGWEKYAENYCWVKNTYYVSPKDSMPDHKDRRDMEIQYYQWVPFVLGLQALMFNIPSIFWKLFNFQSGIHIKSLVQKANDPGNMDPVARDDTLDTVTRHMSTALFNTKDSRIGLAVTIKRAIFRIICCGNTNTGTYLLTLYILTKLLYLGNIILQFVIMGAFLGTHYHFYGFEQLRALSYGLSWEDTAHFPRITYCDFNIRSLGVVRPYTLQCVLVINLFNEKVYIFLWFWFVALLLVTLCNTLGWIGWTILPGRRARNIRKHIKNEKVERDDIDNFMNNLKTDGMFVLKMMSTNSGDLFVNDLIRRLFTNYMKDRENDERTPSSSRTPSHFTPPPSLTPSSGRWPKSELKPMPADI